MASDRPSSHHASYFPPPFPTYLIPTLYTAFSLSLRRTCSINRRDVGASVSTQRRSSASTGTFLVPSPSSSPVCSTSDNACKRVPHLARACPDLLRCSTCASDIAFRAQIVSKGFTGRHGRAILVGPPVIGAGTPSCPGTEYHYPGAAAVVTAALNEEADDRFGDLVNVRIGQPENRQLVTGAHVVADIACVVCGTKLGWKYVDAREPSQRYKVGKFILEMQRVVPYRSWEHVGGEADVEMEVEARCRSDSSDDGTLGVGRLEGQARTSVDEEHVVSFDSDDDDECDDLFAGTWDAGVVAERRRLKLINFARHPIAYGGL
ncbi:hypothetical protein P8C59_003497 [Phyllachora maydis]|uniref:Yippee domain-containing protein n=1 Tax=Phyllachora maydis TaxID=1825666 RepID=A0AAD9MDE5_9PEZI|nr:hypothetical protein P8C59_003497 [Phyllachora maydis]